MRSPELPEGSVFMSSALAWMTMAVPPLLKSEWGPSVRVTSVSSSVTGFAFHVDDEILHVAGVVAFGIF